MNLVTIIIPVYNVELYLHNCVESVLNQNYKNLEIILIDDGSTDKSGIMCDEMANEDNRFRVVHLENQGVSNARNIGLEMAKGEFITFVDSDDTIEPDTVKVMYEGITKFDVDLVITQFKSWYSNSGILVKSKMQYSGRYESMHKIFDDCYFGKNKHNFITSSCGKLYKRKLLTENQLKFDTKLRYGEDTLFVFNYLLHSNNIYILDNFYPYIYNIHDTSTTHKFEKNRYQRRKYMVSKFILLLGGEFKEEYNRVYALIALDVYYPFSKVSCWNNKKLLKDELKTMLKDRELINSYQYLDKSLLGIREKFLMFLFKNNCVNYLFLILLIKNLITSKNQIN